ncbi:hypothetical protein [Yoonia sp. F2084L]|uniref:hypothetical protein n=1 Tax=Yoonia sp. F2084L TaxID=2926419 RepID=UPI001FF1179D|nr:hypothetical protein [Yoonia sp. F2084L]
MEDTAVICTTVMETVEDYQAQLEDLGWVRVSPDEVSDSAANSLAVIYSANELSQALGDELHRGIFANRLEGIKSRLSSPIGRVGYFVSLAGETEQFLALRLDRLDNTYCVASGLLSENSEWLEELTNSRAILFNSPTGSTLMKYSSITGPDFLRGTDSIKLRDAALTIFDTQGINELLDIDLENDLFLTTAVLPR